MLVINVHVHESIIDSRMQSFNAPLKRNDLAHTHVSAQNRHAQSLPMDEPAECKASTLYIFRCVYEKNNYAACAKQ